MISVFEHAINSGLFGDAEAQAPWDAAVQIGHYIAFEKALARGLEKHGLVEPGQGIAAVKALESYKPDIAAIRDAMSRDGVPIPELIGQMRAHAAADAKGIHIGATSQDVLDTALALTLQAITDIVLSRLTELENALFAMISQFGSETLMGRTRMQAALPITVADRIAPVRSALAAHQARLVENRSLVERLQLGGPVGTRSAYGNAADAIAADMARELGLNVGSHVWHADRTAIVDFAQSLTLITGTLGKFGQDIALMAQQGVDEVKLSAGGTSSAMPHKTNPIKAELLVTLARFNAGQAGLMQQAMIHEQERSGSAWMLEWMVLPQITTACCRSVRAAAELTASITING